MQSSLTEERAELHAKASLPRRDFFLLPLVSLVTILLLVGVAEGLTRLVWVEQPDDACQYYDRLGVRHKAFCSSSMKNLEGPWVRYEYNACGYRGRESCGPKSPNVTRFAILGTSIAFGLYVPQNDLFYVRATPALKKILGRPVEFENLGMLGPDLGLQDKMIDEVAGLHPDGVFFIVVPYDLKRLDDKPLWVLQKQETQKHWFPKLAELAYLGRSSRAFFVAQHFILSEHDFAVRAFRMKSDPDDAAHVPPTPVSEQRFQRLEVLVRNLSNGFKSRGIPLYVIPLPSRLEAALIHNGAAIPGVDPLAFSHRLADIARRTGAHCINTTPEFQRVAEPELAFYPVDGHLDAYGNQLVANAIVEYFAASTPNRNK